MIRRPPRSTRTDTHFPYTTLFRSLALDLVEQRRGELVLAAVEPVLRRTIQGADVARDIARVLLDPPASGTGRQHGRHHESGGEHAQGGARRDAVNHAGGIATARMNAK